MGKIKDSIIGCGTFIVFIILISYGIKSCNTSDKNELENLKNEITELKADKENLVKKLESLQKENQNIKNNTTTKQSHQESESPKDQDKIKSKPQTINPQATPTPAIKQEKRQKFDYELCVAYEEMLVFVEKPEFWYYGFAERSPYRKWYEKMQKSEYWVSKDMINIATDYMTHYGEETEFTKIMMPQVRRSIGYDEYLKSKNRIVIGVSYERKAWARIKYLVEQRLVNPQTARFETNPVEKIETDKENNTYTIKSYVVSIAKDDIREKLYFYCQMKYDNGQWTVVKLEFSQDPF